MPIRSKVRPEALLRGCPNCGGDLMPMWDPMFGWNRQCAQCGRSGPTRLGTLRDGLRGAALVRWDRRPAKSSRASHSV